MDFDKLAKFVETNVRDYLFNLFSILTAPWHAQRNGTRATRLSASSGKSWLFALLSISLGSLAYTAGLSATFTPLSVVSIGLVLTVWLWILAAAGAHILVRLMKGKGTFLDTLGVCLSVFSAAYVVSGLVAMTVGLFSRAVFRNYDTLSTWSFLITQFFTLAIYMPVCLGRAHHLKVPGRLLLAAAIPTWILAINVIAIFFVYKSNGPAMAPAPMAPPADQAMSGPPAAAPLVAPPPPTMVKAPPAMPPPTTVMAPPAQPLPDDTPRPGVLNHPAPIPPAAIRVVRSPDSSHFTIEAPPAAREQTKTPLPPALDSPAKIASPAAPP